MESALCAHRYQAVRIERAPITVHAAKDPPQTDLSPAAPGHWGCVKSVSARFATGSVPLDPGSALDVRSGTGYGDSIRLTTPYEPS